MAFKNPEILWLLLALPIFLSTGAALNILAKRDRARFATRELYEQLTHSASRTKRIVRSIMFALGLFFLIIAAAEPRFGTITEIVKRRGVDIVIALDTSYSMYAEDVKPNRIRQAKYEIHQLIDNLEGDRIGLVAFAGQSFVQCPLTSDYSAAKTLLDNIEIGTIPKPGTDIGSAITTSLRLIDKGSERGSMSQLIIIFTDGENLGGNFEIAAKGAASRDVKIYTVGIGTTSGEIIPIRNAQGELEDYKKDSQGNVVKTALDEETLLEIADLTNGEYLRTVNGEVDINALIEVLGSMTKSEIHERKISRLKERYQIPLGASLMFLLIWISAGERRRRA